MRQSEDAHKPECADQRQHGPDRGGGSPIPRMVHEPSDQVRDEHRDGKNRNQEPDEQAFPLAQKSEADRRADAGDGGEARGTAEAADDRGNDTSLVHRSGSDRHVLTFVRLALPIGQACA